MAGNVEEFLLKFRADVGGIAQVGGGLSKLEAQIRNEQRALTGLESKLTDARAKLKDLQGGFGGKVDIGAVNKQRALINSLTGKAGETRGGIDQLKAVRGLAAQSDAMKNAESDAKKMSAALSASASGAARLLATITAIVVAVIAAGAAFVYFAIRAADAARSVRLLNEASAGGTVAGGELSQVIADVASKVPLARDRIGEMARGLQLAKFEGRALQLVLQTMGTVASAAGDSAAGKIQQIAESSRAARRFMLGARDTYGEFADLAGTGLKSADIYAALAASMKVSIGQAKALLLAGRVSVRHGIEALNQAVETRFGKTVAAQLLAMDVQFKKLRENVSLIFSGLDLDPFLVGLKSISDVFSQSTVTGRALRFIAETALQPIINTVTDAAPFVRAFMQGLILGTLLVALVVLKLRKAYLDTFGGDTKGSIDGVKTAMYLGVGAVGALTAVVVVLAIAIGVLAAGVLLVSVPFLLLGYSIYLIVTSIMDLAKAIGKLDLGEAARNMVDSFVNNLTIEKVVTSMTNLGLAAKDALYRALKIRSPSKIAVEAAQNVTTSFANTVEDGTGATRGAFANMVEAGSGRPGGGGGPSGETHFHYHGDREGFADFEEKAEAWYRALLERMSHEGPVTT